MSKGPRAVVVAGPSGVGKGTLIGRLREEYPTVFGFSVSHTTRAPRAGEREGLDYHFTTAEEMRREIAGGGFLEWAEVHGRYYGTSLAAVRRVREQGRICVLDIDVQGCRQVRQKGLDAKLLFIAPPSWDELERRLRERATETEEAILKRMQGAREEMKAQNEKGLFDKVIVNDQLGAAYEELKEFLKDDIAVAKATGASKPAS